MEWSDIEGAFWPDQAEVFELLIRDLPPNPGVVEIGSWNGRSSCMIGQALRARGGRLTCVDRWERNSRPAFLRNTEDLRAAGILQVIDLDFRAALPVFAANCRQPIDLWFYDADHAFAATVEVFRLWEPLIAVNGYAVFHNYDWTAATRGPVREAVDSLGLPGLFEAARMAVWRKRP